MAAPQKSDWLEEVCRIAQDAGRFLLENLGTLSRADISYKGHIDLVTRVDKETEARIIRSIRELHPDHGILAEESERQQSTSKYTWVIDPLDGTTNYIHSFPLFCVSIAVCESDRPILGAICAPYLNELFWASAGEGAFLNGKQLKVSRTQALEEGFFCTGFASMRSPTSPDNIGNFIRLLKSCQGVRRGGSAALELAYVAAGRLDGFWELNLSPWDVAAGSLLVQEAGGRVTDMRGGPGYLHGRNVLATNALLHDALLARIDPTERVSDQWQ
ncbi:MAG: inositol monophosphatase [Candidatus Wallbacteria bacterium]|nr:inositol monophosphatase [Candidatus Wallbacteria bacterium]